ncbi:Beta-glucosidase 29 [Arabidopsis thaliana]|uniref:Glycoside hydrolase family 1 n=1 Tax=Arabidopsis thaliana x Arabidopsis arenosa TaxID=1240361 RepID=A0A8T2FTQ5_9BRAS|nr:Glycoside hydrolase family 1 [Arabidopsis thaliana x Arabidopsis arenosa]
MNVQIFILLLIISWLTPKITSLPPESQVLDRSSFPDDFVFGTAISAFQSEGATSEGGKSPTIWDYFSHTFPERTNMQNADVAVDFYHRYKDDIKLIEELNVDAFRFSISWARLIPSGKVKDGVNKEGVQFYKALIDELIANGIQPSVTLYHWDHPQALEDEYGGFLNPQIIEDFRNFARVCFENFGDKVKMWTTINEPYVISVAGYDTGIKAVGRCSKWVNSRCQAGDSAIEPYIVSHHLLLSHAAAVQEFRNCNKTLQDGKIGIVISPWWLEPYDSTSSADKEAVERGLPLELEWHLNPVIYGDYPETMKKHVGNRLPAFTPEQSKMLINSSDFIGVNYYSIHFTAHLPHIDPTRPRFRTDHHFEKKLINRSNHETGPGDDRGKIHSHPEGLRRVLNYIKDKYNNPIVYVKENGIDHYDDGTKSRETILKDTFRISYHQDHLKQVHKAIIEDGCDVRGYYVWSLFDNFEWEHGYNSRFGMYYVDFKNNLQRYPKDSVNWFKKFLSRPVVRSEETEDEKVCNVSRKEENINKALDVSEGFKSSVDSIVNLIKNGSRIEEEDDEEERDFCAFKNHNDQLGFFLKLQNSLGF